MGISLSNQRAEKLATVEAISDGLASLNYISNLHISTAVFLAHHLDKPVLIEGPPGVGKTELAKSVAALLDMECVRLQCYEGLDESKAIYEWKYGKQLLYTQVLKETPRRDIGRREGTVRVRCQTARIWRCLFL